MESQQEQIEKIESELKHFSTDMTMKFSQQMAQNDKAKAESNKKQTEETTKVIQDKINEANKKIEEKILNVQKFVEKEVGSLKQAAALGGGDSKGMAAAAKQITEECARYFNRMNQTDQRVQAALTEIRGLNENFDNKQDKLKKDMINISNVRN